MEPLQLLLVSFPKEWRDSLTESLQNSDYAFEIHEVSSKKQAVMACNTSKYDILITHNRLPDGSSEDLVHVLASIIPCLVVSDHASPTLSASSTYQHFTERSYWSLMQPNAWNDTLKQVLNKWEESAADKIALGSQDRRLLFDKVAARCASELYIASENRVENALKVILDILEVSRVYIRALSGQKVCPANFLHDIFAPGQSADTGADSSIYEVPIRPSNGQVCFLGVADANHRRVWDQSETDLLKTIASLLKENQEGIRHKITMYRELGMTA